MTLILSGMPLSNTCPNIRRIGILTGGGDCPGLNLAASHTGGGQGVYAPHMRA